MEENQNTPGQPTVTPTVPTETPQAPQAAPITEFVAPVAPSTPADVTPPTVNAPMDPPQQETPAGLEQPAQISAHASTSKHHVVAIVVAVVVFLGLLGAAGYMYMQQNSTSAKTKDTNSNASSESNTPTPVTAADVDDTSKAIDDSLTSIDADKDFSSSDLSDATLGL